MKRHLPEDLGDRPSKLGGKPRDQSHSFVTASNQILTYTGIFPPQSGDEQIILKPTSDNTTDSFGLDRQVKSSVLFRNVSKYDFEPDQWNFQLSDSTSGGTLPPGSESIIWSQRVNTRAAYPGSLTEVVYTPEVSAIELRNYPVTSKIGYQQTVLFSNRVFTASVNPIMVTVAVSMTLSSNPNCSKTWGLFGGNSGYFFRMYGTGAEDSFVVGYRRTLGSGVTEVEVPRSQFNGNKLDGSTGHTLTFTNVAMFGIEVGTAGFGARFWAYVSFKNGSRWTLVHSLLNDSGSSQDRITDEEGLPISFEVLNIGQSSTLETLSKYGTSVTSLGTPIGAPDTNSIAASKQIYPNRSPFPVLGIRATDFINNKKNFNNILGIKLNLSAGVGRWRIVLIKNPQIQVNDTWININKLSGIQYNTARTSFVVGGTQLCQFFLSANKPTSVDLTPIFALNRSFLTAQYTNDAQSPGDFGQQFLQRADELWICAVDANIAFSNNEVIWDESTLIETAPTYEFPESSSLANLATTIHASINILEV